MDGAAGFRNHPPKKPLGDGVKVCEGAIYRGCEQVFVVDE